MKWVFDVSRAAVNIADILTGSALEGVRQFTVGSLSSIAGQLQALGALKIPGGENAAAELQKAALALADASRATDQALAQAGSHAAGALVSAVSALDSADENVRGHLFENVPVSSVVGESFFGIPTSDIVPAFRLSGQDATAADVAADMRDKRFGRAVVLVPGLFCDEGMWYETDPAEEGGPPVVPISGHFHSLGLYPVYLRVNPGGAIHKNGKAVTQLLRDLFTELGPDIEINVVSYSQGGLILRSALYHAGQGADGLAGRINRAVLISSPDGGSYLEKLGFLAAAGLGLTPTVWTQALAIVGDRRSEAIKDLSFGIIREEDRAGGSRVHRSVSELYFGELDAVDAYQIMGVLTMEENPLSDWFGDGIVERDSLLLLSDSVYRAKERPETRVHILPGRSHFKVLPDPETRRILTEILG